MNQLLSATHPRLSLTQAMLSRLKGVSILAVSGCALAIFVAPGAVNAMVTVNAIEDGGDVVFSGGGTLDLTDLSVYDGTLFVSFRGGLVASKYGLYHGAGAGTFTKGYLCNGSSFSGPTSFGTGGGICWRFFFG